jgi:DNA repair exonuclease SbcCD ATPase subunit
MLSRLRAIEKEVSSLRDRELALARVSSDVHDLLSTLQMESSAVLNSITNQAMAIVLDRELEVNTKISVKRSKVASQLVLNDPASGAQGVDPYLSHGGGISNILAIVARVAMIVFSGKERLLILDEPFASVSSNLRADLAVLLDVIQRELNFQIVMVTHQSDFSGYADVHYHLQAPGQLTKVK